ncbi:MAG: hypothetical protein ACRENE_19730 [Polyangiaceae bacterium]
MKIRESGDQGGTQSTRIAHARLLRHLFLTMGSAMLVLVVACTPADPTYQPSAAWVSKPVAHGAADHVRVSDAAAVQGCEYLGDVVFDGYASRGAPAWWAEQQVRELAAARGASDVVLESGRPSTGKAYRCPVTPSRNEYMRDMSAGTDAAAPEKSPDQ